MQFDSDDEREAAEMAEREAHKILAQNSKKATKNAAKLPRTAGLRTITELTTELTKAGYDPSRIEERAALLAKIAGQKNRKRSRDDDDEDVEMDDESGSDGYEDEEMDVDEARPKAQKRQKTNSGGVINKRVPASDRQLAGLKNEAVSLSLTILLDDGLLNDPSSNFKKHIPCKNSPSGRGMPSPRLERPIAKSKPRWSVTRPPSLSFTQR